MRDPYDVLGVPRTADAGAIKSAFRKLAKKLHPDANKNDPKASERFAELNSAYEILGEDAKRKQFDRGEIDEQGKPRGFEGFGANPGGFGGQEGFTTFRYGPGGFQRGAGPAGGRGDSSFEDVLKSMFGGFGGATGGRRSGFGTSSDTEDFGAPPSGQDVSANLYVTMAEASAGTSKRIHLPTGKELDVKVPSGMTDGQQIRLKGQGLPGPGGAGDALITVHVAVDSRFTREGDNLRLELPVTLYEAVLGAKVRAPTLDGAVELAIPPNTSSGRVFRLRGKGMTAKSGHGDLLVTIRIVLPDAADDDLDALMRKWQSSKPYDPRKD